MLRSSEESDNSLLSSLRGDSDLHISVKQLVPTKATESNKPAKFWQKIDLLYASSVLKSYSNRILVELRKTDFLSKKFADWFDFVASLWRLVTWFQKCANF